MVFQTFPNNVFLNIEKIAKEMKVFWKCFSNIHHEMFDEQYTKKCLNNIVDQMF